MHILLSKELRVDVAIYHCGDVPYDARESSEEEEEILLEHCTGYIYQQLYGQENIASSHHINRNILVAYYRKLEGKQ